MKRTRLAPMQLADNVAVGIWPSHRSDTPTTLSRLTIERLNDGPSGCNARVVEAKVNGPDGEQLHQPGPRGQVFLGMLAGAVRQV